jgi:hypothetical protein
MEKNGERRPNRATDSFEGGAAIRVPHVKPAIRVSDEPMASGSSRAVRVEAIPVIGCFTA